MPTPFALAWKKSTTEPFLAVEYGDRQFRSAIWNRQAKTEREIRAAFNGLHQQPICYSLRDSRIVAVANAGRTMCNARGKRNLRLLNSTDAWSHETARGIEKRKFIPRVVSICWYSNFITARTSRFFLSTVSKNDGNSRIAAELLLNLPMCMD